MVFIFLQWYLSTIHFYRKTQKIDLSEKWKSSVLNKVKNMLAYNYKHERCSCELVVHYSLYMIWVFPIIPLRWQTFRWKSNTDVNKLHKGSVNVRAVVSGSLPFLLNPVLAKLTSNTFNLWGPGEGVFTLAWVMCASERMNLVVRLSSKSLLNWSQTWGSLARNETGQLEHTDTHKQGERETYCILTFTYLFFFYISEEATLFSKHISDTNIYLWHIYIY